MDLTTFRKEFTPRLESYIEEQLEALTDEHTTNSDFHEIWEYMTTYVQGGKRVRPYLVRLFYTGLGGNNDTLPWEIGIAHELLHLFALVQDDIIDKGTVRHNLPAYHIRAARFYDNEHVGNAQAILVGDMLFQWAIKQFVTHTDNQEAQNHFFTMLNEVIYGQSLDVHLSHSGLQQQVLPITLKDELKTASYTFLRPMLVGATLANHSQTAEISELALLLGRAYQMRDDLLDITGGHDDKTCLSDLQEGNQTVILYFALANLDKDKRKKLLSFRGKQLTPDEQQQAQDLFEQSGAIEQTTQEINTMLEKAATKLSKIDHDNALISTGVTGLIDYMKLS